MRIFIFLLCCSFLSLNAQTTAGVSIVPITIIGAVSDTLTTQTPLLTHESGCIVLVHEQLSGTNSNQTVHFQGSLDRFTWFDIHGADATGCVNTGEVAYDTGPWFTWRDSGLALQGQSIYNFSQIYYHFRLIIKQEGAGTSLYTISIAQMR